MLATARLGLQPIHQIDHVVDAATGDFRCNLPGPYRSPDFPAAYEAALKGVKLPQSTAAPETIGWLIEEYLGSLRFRDMSLSRKGTIRGELDWLRAAAGEYHFPRHEVRHVEALMGRKEGPTAANTVKQNLSILFSFAAKKLKYTGPNPARFADKLKTTPDGCHTWTDGEIDRFLERHGPGTKARLALLLALNTGIARQDLCGVGWQHVKDGRIAYKRGKTSVLPTCQPADPARAGRRICSTASGPLPVHHP